MPNDAEGTHRRLLSEELDSARRAREAGLRNASASSSQSLQSFLAACDAEIARLERELDEG